jgi:hypothetical protein
MLLGPLACRRSSQARTIRRKKCAGRGHIESHERRCLKVVVQVKHMAQLMHRNEHLVSGRKHTLCVQEYGTRLSRNSIEYHSGAHWKVSSIVVKHQACQILETPATTEQKTNIRCQRARRRRRHEPTKYRLKPCAVDFSRCRRRLLFHDIELQLSFRRSPELLRNRHAAEGIQRWTDRHVGGAYHVES